MQNGHFSGFSRCIFASWFSQEQAAPLHGNCVENALDRNDKRLVNSCFMPFIRLAKHEK